MEKLSTVVLSTAVKTTVVTIVLTAIATIAGLVALVTEVANPVANFSSGLAFATASLATLSIVAVGLIAKADVNTEPGA